MQGSSRPVRGASAPEIHSRAQVGSCVALLIVLTFVVDVNFRLVAFGGFYAIPILISLWLRSFRVTLALTALCCALTFGEALFIAGRGVALVESEPFTLQHLIANHAVEVASLVVVCLIGFWRLRDERELEESRETTATTLASIADGVITVDSARRVTYLNRLAEEMTGFTSAGALGRPVDDVLQLSEEAPASPPIEDMPERFAGPVLTRAQLAQRNGARIPIEKVETALSGARGDVIVFRDITERVQREKDLRTLAYRDTLTNLPNRLSLHELLDLELAHARRNHGSLAVLFIDLDEFKAVNDTFGHAAGDELLRATAARLRVNLRETDTIARLGGDEFAVVLPGAPTARDAELVAAKLLNALEEPVMFEGHALRVRASIGLAMFPKDGTNAEALLRTADGAMYRAKQQGGGKLATTTAGDSAVS
ncbi:MAG TPA: diguanylate cyclase [Planctomycetota bacterium]|nr:diguanylate cyclase [Planctomycetota bacterium]